MDTLQEEYAAGEEELNDWVENSIKVFQETQEPIVYTLVRNVHVKPAKTLPSCRRPLNRKSWINTDLCIEWVKDEPYKPSAFTGTILDTQPGFLLLPFSITGSLKFQK